jgi:hypothetical protein
MKSTRVFLLSLFVISAFKVSAQSSFLLPENFYLKKTEKLQLHLLQSDDFVKQTDLKYQPTKVAKFILVQGKKPVDLKPMATDTGKLVLNYETPDRGIALIDLVSVTEASEMSRSKFLRNIDEDDPDKIADKVKNSNQLYYKEKFTTYMKTLFISDKTSGSAFSKPLGDDYEITLQQNPYNFNYGDDVSALITFKGKPISVAEVDLFVKTANGDVFPQKLSSDAGGLIYFKLSREGIYILRSKHFEISKDKTADFESWRATYTFGFSSSNELPNTYREFGLGNKH